MRVIIAGGRDITDYELIKRAILDSKFPITEVVSGGCRGVDLLGEQWAEENDVIITRFLADWDKFGKSAGPRRNSDMIEYVGTDGGLILIWNGQSRGSKNIREKAITRGLVFYEIVVINGEQ